ncbi:MAG: sigma 54-interacting transcriptional regulator [Betaproteobacteria bacterium]|jgi:transcriptional regulator with PAS, ATPase and Fis domain|nr:sigma 54-interacting transcriptional regulator [Betaproteobacteria bacterium]HNP05776.1 sigma 54-interacting transcriptional regulator [Rhodocyclaceae bacterium]
MIPRRFSEDADVLRRRAMESLFSELADLCQGMVLVDQVGRIVWMNGNYPKKLGVSDVEAVIGKPIQEVIPNSLMGEVAVSGRPMMLDIMDFENESFVVMRLPVHDESGSVIGAIGLMLFDDARQLAPVVSRYQKLRADLADAQRKLAEARRTKYTFASFVGISPECAALKDEARRVARSSSPVLLLGETGTGKELLAQAIHAAGPRADASFVAINIAAVPETLLEAEFFGVAAGAYTGADRRGRDGKFQLAHNGTLFLDEIGDMSPSIQAKLLRVLQEQEVEPVGSNRLVPVDVRIIAATSRDLARDVKEGRFRADLYYRLNVVILSLPPLRERLDDLPLLCENLMEHIARQHRLLPKNISPQALARLREHDWPGNVRELRNILERAIQLTDADTLEVACLERILPKPTEPGSVAGPSNGSLGAKLQDTERVAIERAIAQAGGNKSEAAKILGISRASLYEKIEHLGLKTNKR